MSSPRRPASLDPLALMWRARPLLLGSLLAMPLAALAQAQDSNPYYFGGSLGLTHVSNIYRTAAGSTAPQGQANDDTVTTASLLGGVDLRLGREHLTANAALQSNHYERNSLLDNLGYNGRMGLDWATVDNISGTISLGGSRQLSSNVPGYGYSPVYVKNVETDYSADALTRIGLVTRWTLEADLNYNRRSFSADTYKSLDYQQTSYSLGPTYRPSELLRIGVDLRHTRGSRPFYAVDIDPGTQQFVYVANDFNRDDVDLNVYWKASGANQFEARLSSGRSHHLTSAGQDFSGFTGQLNWYWQPTGRLSFTSQLIRDTGLQTAFASFLGQSSSSFSEDQLVTTARSYASYQYSAKLSFNASASFSRGRLAVNVPNQTPPESLNLTNTDYAASLGAAWQISRGISFSCQMGRQERTGDIQLNPYKANNVGCVGQWIVY